MSCSQAESSNHFAFHESKGDIWRLGIVVPLGFSCVSQSPSHTVLFESRKLFRGRRRRREVELSFYL